MRKIAMLLPLLAVPTVAGCFASKEDAGKLLQEMVADFNELATILGKVHDADSSKKAEPKVDAVFAKLKDLKVPGKKVTANTKDALMKEYQKPLEEADRKVGVELARLQNVPGAEGVVKRVQEIRQWTQKQG